MKYVIGVDVGTQGTKAALFDENGAPVAFGTAKTELIYGKGSIEQSPDDLFDSVLTAIRAALEAADGVTAADVAGVGIDGQMAGLMSVDASLAPVMNYDSWLDNRCAAQAAKMDEICGEEVVRSTGGQVSITPGAKMLWLRDERPDLYRRTAAFLMLSGYLSARLCGLSAEEAFFDPTHLHFSGFADNAHTAWNGALCDRLGLDRAKLPRILPSTAVVGGVTGENAKRCGLLAGTPVVAGCGDSAASALGAGIIRPGVAYDVAGTASILSVSTEVYAPDVKNRTILYMRSVVPDLWTPLAYIGGGGLCLSWYKKKSGLSYAELDAGAETAPIGADGLFFVPHFEGRVCPFDPALRGAFFGLRWTHTAAHEFRAVMESVAVEYARYLSILTEGGVAHPDRIIGAGGGAGSPVFAGIKANFLQADYQPLAFEESGVFGSAVTAGVGVGLYPSFAVADRVARRDPIPHDPSTAPAVAAVIAAYGDFMKKYEALCH